MRLILAPGFVLALFLLVLSSAAAAPLLEYNLVDQWPELNRPVDQVVSTEGLAVAANGTVFLVDGSANRVTMMAPDGTWLGELGNHGNGPELLGNPRAIEINNDAGLVYVADIDSYRLVVFDLEGDFVTAWPDIYASGLSMGPDGRLWVADQLTTKVRAFDARGQEVFSFGVRGSGSGKFRQLSDVAAAPSGELYVGDRGGSRIQVFRPEGDSLRLVRTLDLTDPKYRQQVGGRPPGGPPGPGGRGPRERRCTSNDISVIDDETLLAFPCLIQNGEVTFLRGPQASANVFGFFLPYVNVGAGLFYSMGVYDADRNDPRNETFPAIVHYTDSTFSTLVESWRLGAFDQDAFRGPQRVDAHPNGTVYITDFRGVRRYSTTGESLNLLPVQTFPTEPISVTLTMATGDGTADGVVGFGRCLNAGSANAFQQPCLGYYLIRTKDHLGEPLDYLEPVWTTSVDAEAEITALHYDGVNDLLLMINNADQELRAYQRLGRGRKETWPLGGSDRTALFTDVGSGPDGIVYVLDALRDQIQVRDRSGKLQRTLKAPSDAWRLAGGPDGSVLVLTAFGEVVRLGAGGAEMARFNAKPNENAQARNLSDLSVAADGRVFVADRLASLVSVFAPTGRDAPEVLAGQSCIVRGAKTADPAQVSLTDEIQVELGLDGSCGSVEQPSHILVLVNTKNAAALAAARQVVSLADFQRHRLGLMGYYVSTLFKVRWTQDVSKIITGLESLNAGGGAESNEANALRQARRELSLVDGRAVVVLIGAEYCVKSERPDCEEQTDAEPAAADLWSDGVRVVVVNGTADSRLLASSDLDVVGFGFGLGGAVPVYQRIANLLHPAALLKTVTVADVIPANLEWVAGSAQPPAAWDPASRTLTWTLADVPYRATALRYRLRPTVAGRWPTNVEAHADYTDGWDGQGRVVFPVPEVEVVVPPPPTATPSPVPTATPLPTARPTAAPRSLFLPLVQVDRCAARRLPLEVVLAIDVSSSMAEPTRPGGPAKLAAARAAATLFLDAALAPQDRVALVTFEGAAHRVVDLTADRAAVRAALDGLVTGYGTRLDLGLAAAVAALSARRPEATAAIILLTDGRSSGARPAVERAAAAARAGGIEVVAIGLGDDVDGPLLAAIATRPEWYFAAPETEDLVSIYAGLPAVLPCP